MPVPCRYRSLAGHSLRALRLDLALAVLHHLQDLPSNNWACEEEEASEVCSYPCKILTPHLLAASEIASLPAADMTSQGGYCYHMPWTDFSPVSSNQH